MLSSSLELFVTNYTTKSYIFLFMQAPRPRVISQILFFKTQDLTLTIINFLTYDRRQLAQYLKRNSDNNNNFNISGLIGVKSLLKNQRNKLARRLR